jgi:hypothetical protein
MPSRQLIYLTVFGTGLWPLAEACVQSLRAAGRFHGDVWVFCDHPPLAVEAEHRPADARADWEHICAARIDLGLTLPFEQYDAIAYLDADCLATAPLAPLFEGPGRFGAMEDRKAMGTSGAANGGLTEAERRQANCRSACSGVVAGGTAVFREALSAWKALYDGTPAGFFRDQHSLNTLLYRRIVPARLFPRSVVTPIECEADGYRQAPLLHFSGAAKVWMLPAWQRWRQRHRRGAPARPDGEVPRISAVGLRRGRGATWWSA